MDPKKYQSRLTRHQGTFVNDGWFPDLDLETLQKRYRIDAATDETQLTGLILQSVILTNQNLTDFACKQYRAGYETMAEIPNPGFRFARLKATTDDVQSVADAVQEDTASDTSIGSYYVELYQNAVFYRVKGDITRELSHHSMTHQGQKRQVDYHDLSADFYRQSTWAVRLIKGKRTSRIRLL